MLIASYKNIHGTIIALGISFFQKTNQILTLGKPPQNLFNLGQFEVFITLTSLT
jgi:hypothetical protein